MKGRGGAKEMPVTSTGRNGGVRAWSRTLWWCSAMGLFFVCCNGPSQGSDRRLPSPGRLYTLEEVYPTS